MKCLTLKPKMTFTVHGEGAAIDIYAQAIRNELGWNVTVPEYLQTVSLFEGI